MWRQQHKQPSRGGAAECRDSKSADPGPAPEGPARCASRVIHDQRTVAVIGDHQNGEREGQAAQPGVSCARLATKGSSISGCAGP